MCIEFQQSSLTLNSNFQNAAPGKIMLYSSKNLIENPVAKVAILRKGRTDDFPSHFPIIMNRSVRENSYRVVALVFGARPRVGRVNTVNWAILGPHRHGGHSAQRPHR